MDSLVAALLQTDRLRLTPLEPADAAAMVDVLSSPDLYTFTGDSPPDHSELERRYRAQVAGPTSGDETWLNWIVRLEPEPVAVGFVQATVVGGTADVAWVIGVDWQSRGFATEAGRAMCDWLAARRVTGFTAHIHPTHVASQRVAAAIGLEPTAEVDDDGEVVWATPGP